MESGFLAVVCVLNTPAAAPPRPTTVLDRVLGRTPAADRTAGAADGERPDRPTPVFFDPPSDRLRPDTPGAAR